MPRHRSRNIGKHQSFLSISDNPAEQAFEPSDGLIIKPAIIRNGLEPLSYHCRTCGNQEEDARSFLNHLLYCRNRRKYSEQCR